MKRKPLSTKQLSAIIKKLLHGSVCNILLNTTGDSMLVTIELNRCDETSDEFNYLVKKFGGFERTPHFIECITACQYVSKDYLLRVRLA